MPEQLSQEQLLLINILLRIAVMAGITNLVLSFGFVLEYLTRRKTGVGSRLKLFVLLSLAFSVGVVVRKLVAQGAMDLSLEGAMLGGLIGGMWVGGGVGLSIGLACYLVGEPIGLLLYTGVGFISGFLYTILDRERGVWSYSLNPFFVIYNFLEKLFKGSLDRNFIPFALIFIFAFIRYKLLAIYSGRRLLYGFLPRNPLFLALDLVVLVYTVGIALKMISNARIELLLEEEERQLMNARLATLRSQINPHFLFNTLNSISALIRTDSEKAREMTRKLASIFRKSLEESSDLHPFSEELEFIEDYLSIEKVRFGDERLVVERDVDKKTLNFPVPFMILQPIIENAVKHGISRILERGRIKMSARMEGKNLVVIVENDGPVCEDVSIEELTRRGVGLKNVIERLNIYSKGRGKFNIKFKSEGGAIVTLVIPSKG